MPKPRLWAAALAAALTVAIYPMPAAGRQAGGGTTATPAQPPAQPPGRGQGGGGRGQGGGGDPWPGMKRLLAVADVQSGFHHDSISHALATVEQIGRKSGVYATMIRTDSQLVTNDPIVGRDRYEGRS